MWGSFFARWARAWWVWMSIVSALLVYFPDQAARVLGSSPGFISAFGDAGLGLSAVHYLVRRSVRKMAPGPAANNTTDPVEPAPKYKEL